MERGSHEETAMTRCPACDSGERQPALRPQVAQRDGRVAVVTDVPVEVCASCGETWIPEAVALILDGLLAEMLRTDVVAVRPFPASARAVA
jgi:YgiT-type zinc finger domain-containing protein